GNNHLLSCDISRSMKMKKPNAAYGSQQMTKMINERRHKTKKRCPSVKVAGGGVVFGARL
ncbi:MAG: hypothetical protein AAFY76_12750, partial [Cyanobacteria bacterium J06649_11]